MRVKEKNINFIISFLAASFSMCVILMIAGLIGAGEHCFIDGDLGSQYIPFIRNLARDIREGESIWYCRSVGLGINQSLLNAYYAINPFNLLYLIFWNGDVNTITGVIVVLKTGLAAMCFQLYLSKGKGITDERSIFFSLAYALCSFNIAYDLNNIVWYDSFVLLPIVCLMIERLVTKGKYVGLAISFSYLFIVQFYMGYMVGVFSVLYLIIVIVSNWDVISKKMMVQTILKYVLAAVLGVMTSAVVWIPTACFLIEKKSADVTKVSKLGTNVIDILNQFFFLEIHTYRGKLPYFYCGVAILLLLPVFFMLKDIRKKEKIAWLSVLAVMLMSCILTPLYAMWHGFDMPDGWGFRFGYIITFVVCSIAALASQYLDKIKEKWILIEIAAMIAIYVAGIFVMKERYSSARHNDIIGLAINIGLFLAWFGILYLIKKEKSKSKSLYACIVLALMVELTVNGYLISDGTFVSVRGFFDLYEEKVSETLKELETEDNGYRINMLNEYAMNSGAYFGYDSVGYFATAENYEVRQQLRNLGVYSSQALCYGYGMTPVTDMLLGVKYTLANKVDAEDYSYDVVREDNERALSIGYIVDDQFKNCSIVNGNAFENNNIVISSMCGEDIQVFVPEQNNVDITGSGMWLDFNENGDMVFGYDRDSEIPVSEMSLNFVVNSDEEKTYAYAENYYSKDIMGAFILAGGYENIFGTLGKLSVSYIKEMNEEDGKQILRIMPTEEYSTETIKCLYFYNLDSEKLDKVYERLSDEQLIIDEYRDGYIKGTIEAKEDNRLIFISVPYDKGWKVTLNGEKYSTIPLLDGAFTGIELPSEGSFDIEMKYEAKGAKAGMIVSILGILALAAISLGMKGKKETDGK